MPSRNNKQNNRNNKNNKIKTPKKSKKVKKPNISLYADYHPETSVKGYGYADKEKALKTIEKLKKLNRGRTYDLQVINTMYNRAKYHKFRTKKMEEAMKVFQKYLKKLKNQ